MDSLASLLSGWISTKIADLTGLLIDIANDMFFPRLFPALLHKVVVVFSSKDSGYALVPKKIFS